MESLSCKVPREDYWSVFASDFHVDTWLTRWLLGFSFPQDTISGVKYSRQVQLYVINDIHAIIQDALVILLSNKEIVGI